MNEQAQAAVTKYAQTLKGYSVWDLNTMAECLSPDKLDSDGANWLDGIRDEALEVMDDKDFDLDMFMDEDVSRIADRAVDYLESRSIYRKWSVFTELGGWQEDLGELGDLGTENPMDKGANWALYLIASKLLVAIAQEITGAINHAELQDEGEHISRCEVCKDIHTELTCCEGTKATCWMGADNHCQHCGQCGGH